MKCSKGRREKRGSLEDTPVGRKMRDERKWMKEEGRSAVLYVLQVRPCVCRESTMVFSKDHHSFLTHSGLPHSKCSFSLTLPLCFSHILSHYSPSHSPSLPGS